MYQGWGAHWPLGTLADVGGRLLFEYSSEAVARGLQFAPLQLPLPLPGAAQAATSGPAHFHGLPGFIADSLPDGWGLLLMDRVLRKAGRDPHAVSALERLAIVGPSAIGPLAFEPADAMEAERASVKYKQAEYLMDRIGEEFDGLISGVSKWGIFVELTESKCEGMVSLRLMNDDFYYLDEENYRIIGQRWGKIYRLGDAIRIRVKKIDLQKKQMDFDLVK